MPNYGPLVTLWSTFNGSSLTTQQRIDNVNARTVSGPAVPMVIPTYKIYNLIASTEVTGLSAAQAQNIRDILSMGTVDVSAGTNARARLASALSTCTLTIASLTALSTAFDTPQLQLVTASTGLGGLGLPSALNLNDLAAAGGLS